MKRMQLSRTVASVVAGLAIAIAVVGGVAVARSAGGDAPDPALTSSQQQRDAHATPSDGADPTTQLAKVKQPQTQQATAGQAGGAEDGAVVAQVDSAQVGAADGAAATTPARTSGADPADDADVASLDSVVGDDGGDRAEPADQGSEDDHATADGGAEDPTHEDHAGDAGEGD